MSKTIGIFGGAFDPVHIGHSKLVSDIKKIFDFEKILIIPSGKPVLKSSHFADSIKRIEMLNVAFKNTQDVFIDDRETLKEKTSFTIETLREICKEYESKQHFSFILGQDSFESFKSWKNWEEILTLCSLIVISRPNFFISQDYLDEFKNNITRSSSDFLMKHGKIFFAETSMLDISSSEIRKKVYKKEFKKKMLEDQVLDFIKKNSLYKN
ncbi:nicotinate (nicotinamide) nucleotide adenylyltransferase [Gammaproteobacteria bacterium]|nr:nicotinate (nicotinamide) nucleotide adenylyltransferase [Gammaproteobacteria bacterium]